MMIVEPPVADLKIVQSSPHRDARGAFVRFFCSDELQAVLQHRQIAQINHSRTSRVGAVRGMHFQYPPHAEMKMIRCLRGRVWDVAVDLRPTSSTFLRWHAEELAQGDARVLVIPEGFAHGFQVLEPDSELLYLHTAFYNPTSEGGLRYDDPRLGIAWPLPPLDLSPRDLSHPLLDNNFRGVAL
nr:dTDP-4-dehydrorhamnose 3,5-epimerase [Mycobacterium lepraemurium]